MPWDWPLSVRVKYATDEYLKRLDTANPPEPYAIQSQLYKQTSDALITHFQIVRKDDKEKHVPQYKLGTIKDLTSFQVAALLTKLHKICEVVPGGASSDDGLGLLAIYQESGEYEGTYRRADLGLLERLAHRFNQNATVAWFKEVERHILRMVEKVPECTDPDLVFMKNAIFNYRTNEWLPFSPELVRLTKYQTNLPDLAPQIPKIQNADGTFWTPTDWLEEILPDPDLRNLVLQVIGASLRPRVSWLKLAIFIAQSGSNGKGTVLDLIRSIVGPALVANVPWNKFGTPFGLEQILGKQLNLVDEVDGGIFVEEVANLKSIVTNDPVTVNRKNKPEISYRPSMFNIQSANEWPRFKDKSDAMLRRLLFVSFNKRFIDSADNRAIRDDYIHREEVREWFAYEVLVNLPKYYSLDEGAASKKAMKEYRLVSNPIEAYFDEYFVEFQRDFLPFQMLYAHFKATYKEANPSGRAESAHKVTKKLKELVDSDEWIVVPGANGKDKEFSVSQWMVGAEPVLAGFKRLDELSKWNREGQQYHGYDDVMPPPKARGFVRKSAYERYEASNVTPKQARLLGLQNP